MVNLEVPRKGGPTAEGGSSSDRPGLRKSPSQDSVAGSGSMSPRAPAEDPKPTDEQTVEVETLESLLATLTGSHTILKREKAKAESQRAAAARRAASERAGRFVGGGPWRCPCSVPEQFNVPERLPPGRFFKPFEAAIVDRPARAYEHIDGPPFMAYDSNSRMFGEAPPLPQSPKSLLSTAGSLSLGDTSRASPTKLARAKTATLGDAIFSNATSGSLAMGSVSREQKTPRAATLQGMLASPTGPRWHAATACPRELNHWDFLQERVVAPPGARMGGPFTAR